MEWTDARIQMLRRLWREGLSAGEISARLEGATRNAVLGKLSRLKLLGTRATASRPGRAPAEPRAPSGIVAALPPLARCEPEWPELDVPESAFAPLPGATPRPWLSRGPLECAFPAGGEGAGLLSCCAPTQARSAYCAVHHARVYRPKASQCEREAGSTLPARRMAA